MKGLLTYEETKAISEEAHVWWALYEKDRAIATLTWNSREVFEGINHGFQYAPVPGYWLPMSTAPKDGRTIEVHIRHGSVSEVDLIHWGTFDPEVERGKIEGWRVVGCAVDLYQEGVDEFIGWRPWVTTED